MKSTFSTSDLQRLVSSKINFIDIEAFLIDNQGLVSRIMALKILDNEKTSELLKCGIKL
jgi:hypothetical protein